MCISQWFPETGCLHDLQTNAVEIILVKICNLFDIVVQELIFFDLYAPLARTQPFHSSYRWILKALGEEMTDEEIDDIIAEIDTDGSGTVDYNGEF